MDLFNVFVLKTDVRAGHEGYSWPLEWVKGILLTRGLGAGLFFAPCVLSDHYSLSAGRNITTQCF